MYSDISVDDDQYVIDLVVYMYMRDISDGQSGWRIKARP